MASRKPGFIAVKSTVPDSFHGLEHLFQAVGTLFCGGFYLKLVTPPLTPPLQGRGRAAAVVSAIGPRKAFRHYLCEGILRKVFRHYLCEGIPQGIPLQWWDLPRLSAL
jgi:hypothetical protein